jgi:DNA-binding YbaB/EbfC family protein
MFGKLGQLASLFGNLPRIQEDVQKFQGTLGNLVAEGDAGGGAVKVRVNGRMEVVSCQLLDSARIGGDRELLEDLIKAATNQALAKAREQVGEGYKKMFASLGLPTGMGTGMPGLF